MELHVRLSPNDHEQIAQRVAEILSRPGGVGANPYDQMILDAISTPLANVGDVARALGINRGLIDTAIRRKHNPLPTKRFGRRLKIPVAALINWLHQSDPWQSADTADYWEDNFQERT